MFNCMKHFQNNDRNYGKCFPYLVVKMSRKDTKSNEDNVIWNKYVKLDPINGFQLKNITKVKIFNIFNFIRLPWYSHEFHVTYRCYKNQTSFVE